MDDIIVTLADAKELNYCNKGIRKKLKQFNLSWNEFITTGIPLSKLEHIDDAMLIDVINVAKQRVSQ